MEWFPTEHNIDYRSFALTKLSLFSFPQKDIFRRVTDSAANAWNYFPNVPNVWPEVEKNGNTTSETKYVPIADHHPPPSMITNF